MRERPLCIDNSRLHDYILNMSFKPKPAHPACPPEERLFLALLKTADTLGQEAERLTKSIGLTGTQYNVLRILRGAGPDGLPCRGIGERMISRDPDMTRLLDRMEKGGLITRARQKDDRRVVKTQITEEGLGLLQKLDQPMRELHKKQFQHMSAAQMKTLGDLMDVLKKREAE
jgi:MarR family transcriptional regulator, organic hydroperoxide resistance regulator